MFVSVLILDAGGTQALPIAESLYKAGFDIHGFFSHKLSYGYGSRFIKHKHIVQVRKAKEYVVELTSYIQQNDIKVIMPMSDRTAEWISLYQNSLKEYVSFETPSYDSFIKGYDKNKLMHICRNCNAPHPRTIDLQDGIKTAIVGMSFPALIKPNITTGGRGMTLVKDIAELHQKLPIIEQQYGLCHLQEFIQPGGKQIKVQLFVNESSELLYSSVLHKQRYYPENGGSSSCNETIINEDVVAICSEVLKKIEWKGFADFDLIEDPKDGVLKIMEINPRVPACVKSAIKSGVDYGKIYVDYALGKELKLSSSKAGYKLRHIGFEVLWFLKSKKRFKTHPSWFRFFVKNLFFQDFAWNDPLPFFYGTIENIKQMLNPKFRKQKGGINL